MVALAGERHADEIQRGRALQTLLLDIVRNFGAPRLVGHQDQVRAEELVRIAHQRLAHAVGEERDAGHARHRDGEGDGEHAQLARAPVAHEHPPGLPH